MGWDSIWRPPHRMAVSAAMRCVANETDPGPSYSWRASDTLPSPTRVTTSIPSLPISSLAIRIERGRLLGLMQRARTLMGCALVAASSTAFGDDAQLRVETIEVTGH